MEEQYNLFGREPEEQLAKVNDAIFAVLKGGQSYRIGTKQLTRADLEILLEMQSKLKMEVAANQESALLTDTYAAVFDRR